MRIAKIGLRKENPQMRGEEEGKRIAGERKENKSIRGGGGGGGQEKLRGAQRKEKKKNEVRPAQ